MRDSRRNRVPTYVRVLSGVIVPFLLAAFVILYVCQGDTKRLVAWTIKPTMTPMVLASAYLGGAYYFVRVLGERRWTVITTGFLSVALVASLLGVATIVHRVKLNHQHVSFWTWATLYFTTPFLVVGGRLANRRFEAAAGPDELRLSKVARALVGLVGLLALVWGIVMLLAPATVIGIGAVADPQVCRIPLPGPVVGGRFPAMSATAGERIARRWDGRADRAAQEYLVRAAGWSRRIGWVVAASFAVAAVILLTGRLDVGRVIATMAVPVVASGLATHLIFRRSREFRRAASIISHRQGLPSDTYLDFRGVAAFDRSLARARSRPAAR